jgi:hypothetical protein
MDEKQEKANDLKLIEDSVVPASEKFMWAQCSCNI